MLQVAQQLEDSDYEWPTHVSGYVTVDQLEALAAAENLSTIFTNMAKTVNTPQASRAADDQLVASEVAEAISNQISADLF